MGGQSPRGRATAPRVSAELAAAALNLADAGWPVFPCWPDNRPRTPHGFHDATTDTATIRAWWTCWPDAPIGAAVPASLAVIDIDVHHDDANGFDTLARLEAAHGGLPPTLVCCTGGGGRHLYFLHPDGALRQGVGILGPGLDTRMPGKGYVILPPSSHESGRRYEWLDPATPVAAMPSWLVALLRPPPLVPPDSVAYVATFGEPHDRYVAAAVEGEAANVLAAPVGIRNRTLHCAAVRLGGLVGAGYLDDVAAFTALLDPARASGYTTTDGERAAWRTIESGLTWGRAHPRTVP